MGDLTLFRRELAVINVSFDSEHPYELVQPDDSVDERGSGEGEGMSALWDDAY